MTFDYTRSATTAAKLIAKFGQAGSFKRTAAGTGPAYDPGDGATTSHACTLVDLEYNDHEIDGTLIRTGDKKVFVSTSGVSITPAVSDRLVIGDASYEIMSIKPLAPGGTVVFWEIQARN